MVVAAAWGAVVVDPGRRMVVGVVVVVVVAWRLLLLGQPGHCWRPGVDRAQLSAGRQRRPLEVSGGTSDVYR